MTRFLKIFSVLMVSVTGAMAYTNVLDNSSTQTVSSSWYIPDTDIVVGGSTVSNYMKVAYGGVASNATTTIGRDTGSDHNTLLVDGSSAYGTIGAAWTTSGDLYIGENGSSNRLIIYNGVVENSNAWVGASSSATGNTVMVSSTNSYWNSKGVLNLTQGSSNSVNISSGGTVLADSLEIGGDNEVNLDDGTLHIRSDFDAAMTGFNWNEKGRLSLSNSVLTGLTQTNGYAVLDGGRDISLDDSSIALTGTDLAIGYDGADSALSIGNGSTVSNANGIIGMSTNTAYNQVFVSGSNSVWNNSGDLTVGQAGERNQLYMYDQGRVASDSLVIGQLSNAVNNAVTVTGSNSTLLVAGDLTVGDEGRANELNGLSGATIENDNAYVGKSAGVNSNTVTIAGADANWINNGEVSIGSTSNSGNAVSVSAGGTITADKLNIASNNAFYVKDAGTVIITGAHDVSMDGFNWGSNGTVVARANLTGLTETNGASVLDGGKRLVLDKGGRHSTTNDLVVGYETSGAFLAITNKGGAVNADGYIGWGENAADNAVLVSDNGSAWTNNGNLYVGVYGTNLMNAGSGNSLTVSNSAWVAVGGVDPALTNVGVTVSGNAELVVGDGASVLAEDGMYVGSTNSAGTVSVWKGGSVVASTLNIGTNGSAFKLDGSLQVKGDFNADQDGFNFNSGASLTVNSTLTYTADLGKTNQTLNIDGGNWNRGSDLQINGVSNTLNIVNDGSVSNGTAILGSTASDFNNTVLVSGEGSAWTNAGNLVVGLDGSGNRLEIKDQGHIYNQDAYIGSNVTAFGNSALVSGSNSVWNSTDDLYVGYAGSSNTLTISNSGTVENENGTIGSAASASNNMVLVTGSGSVWTNRGDLMVGDNGTGNSLMITDGAAVFNDAAVIGNSSLASNNLVTVQSNGTWRSTTGNLQVGVAGSGNELKVTSGGRVESDGGIIGSSTSASNNTVTISGNGSLWDNSGDLVLGKDAAAHALYLMNGGVVSNVNGIVGQNGSAVSNLVSVSGEGSAWVNSGTLTVGATNNSGNLVTIHDGGRVTAADLEIYGDNGVVISNTGTLAMTGSFNLSSQTNKVDWQRGGEIAIEGDLTGTSEFDGEGLVLSVDGGTWTNATDKRVIGKDGSDNQFNIVNGGYVVNTNAIVGSGTHTSNNAVLVSGSGSIWETLDTLTVGTTDELNSGNSVTVTNNGRVVADILVVNDGHSFNIDYQGTLHLTGNVNLTNLTASGVNWNEGGNVSVGGELTGLKTIDLGVDGLTNRYQYIDEKRTVTLDGSKAFLSVGGDTNLIVGLNSSGNKLQILNGGTVDNANGYIGWGSSAANNAVLVSGQGSTWTNRNNLYIGGYQTTNGWVAAPASGSWNTLTVEDEGWVLVGDVTTNDIAAPAAGVGSIAVGGADGAELILGASQVKVGSMYVGAGSSLTGSVKVMSGGVVELDDLIIDENLGTFSLAGTLLTTNGFNAGMAGFEWENSGAVTLKGGDLTGISELHGTNKVVTLESADWSTNTLLSIGSWGSGNELNVSGDSTITSAGGVIGGSNAVNNSVLLSGSGVLWTNSVDLIVGEYGSGNSLTIEAGATNVNSGTIYIGRYAGSSNNTVTVSGSNTLWSSGGNLYVGGEGSNSMLNVSGQSTVKVGDSLFVQHGSTLSLGSSNTTITVENDMTLADSSITGIGEVVFGAGNNSTLFITGPNSSITNAIYFNGNGGVNSVDVSNSVFVVDGSLTNRFSDDFANLIMADSTLTAGGELDVFENVSLNGGVLELTDTLTVMGELEVEGDLLLKLNADHQLNLNNAAPFSLTNITVEVTVDSGINDLNSYEQVILSTANGYTNRFKGDVKFNERYLLYDFKEIYSNSNKQVTMVPVAAADGALSSSLAYGGSEGVKAGFYSMKNSVFARTKSLRRNIVSTAHNVKQKAAPVEEHVDAPVGAFGPGDENTIFDMHAWAQYFNGQGSYAAQGNSDGFDLNNNGTTFGLDRLIGEDLTVGLNYTYARSGARTTNGDAVDSETYWVGGYGEWVGENGLYVDGLFSYGRSNYDSQRTEDNYLGSASYRGQNFGGYIDVGQYYYYKNLSVTPYGGLHFLTTGADSHTEREQDGNEVRVDEFNRAWLESAFGLKARYRMDTGIGRFQATGFAEWTHDFIQDDVESSLSTGTIGPVLTSRVSPDPDTLGAGVGLGWICTDYMEIGVGYNLRRSEDYEEHTGSLMFDIMF